MGIFSRKTHTGDTPDEHRKIERLEKAEKELTTLQARATKAIHTLDSRRQRNHWRESIEHMIHGGT